MVEAIQKLWTEAAVFLTTNWERFHAGPDNTADQDRITVGEFQVDYSDIPADRWRADIPEADELIRRSKVVSAKGAT